MFIKMVSSMLDQRPVNSFIIQLTNSANSCKGKLLRYSLRNASSISLSTLVIKTVPDIYIKDLAFSKEKGKERGRQTMGRKT